MNEREPKNDIKLDDNCRNSDENSVIIQDHKIKLDENCRVFDMKKDEKCRNLDVNSVIIHDNLFNNDEICRNNNMKDDNCRNNNIKFDEKRRNFDIKCSEEQKDNLLQEIKDYAKENFIPIVREDTAKRLAVVCRDYNPNKILEIGTAIGYSGIIMLKSCSAHLFTIEKEGERASLAEENFKRYNFLDRITQFVDDAQIVIEKMCNSGEKFDLIFLDGPKGQYVKYYLYLKKLLAKGGVLFCDNINLLGYVKQEGKIPHKHRSMVNNLRKFIEILQNDSDFETEFYDIDDGYSISKKVF